MFTDATVLRDNPAPDFVVKVSDSLVSMLGERAEATLHNCSIVYGIERIRSTRDEAEFLFTSDEHQRLMSRPFLEGEQLRLAVLEFHYDVYKLWPNEPIGLVDLIDNLSANEDQIRVWRNDPALAGLLIERGDRKNSRLRGFADMPAFTIAPVRRKDVEVELAALNRGSERRLNAKPLVFLSYSTKDKLFAAKIKAGLTEVGFDVFMAHEDLTPSDEWIVEIRKNLKRCDALVPILTPNFRGSDWTDQETGYGLAFDKIIIPLMFDKPPHGFLGPVQGLRVGTEPPEEIAKQIATVSKSKTTATL